jgi:phosphoribosyl 1,2-cyclic phosphate phosphodiesterase
VDSGPDFRQQILREDIQRLDALLFTHEHKDHTAGMDDIRSFNFAQKQDIPIYGRKAVIEQLKREFAYIFEKARYPGIPKVEINEIINAPFKIQGQTIIPIEVMHLNLPVFGFRFKDITYITDAKTISDQEREKIKGSKILIINALHKKEHYSHMNVKEALEFASEIQAEQTYFTHISHLMGTHREVEKELPENVHLAYDGLKLQCD